MYVKALKVEVTIVIEVMVGGFAAVLGRWAHGLLWCRVLHNYLAMTALLPSVTIPLVY